MKLKLIVAILVIAAVPVCAQAQKPSAAKVTKADAQKVVKIIKDDKAKTQIYCDIAKLGDQADDAAQKKDEKKADELNQKMEELAKKLGPEYNALLAALQGTDMESEDGQEIGLDSRDASTAYARGGDSNQPVLEVAMSELDEAATLTWIEMGEMQAD